MVVTDMFHSIKTQKKLKMMMIVNCDIKYPELAKIKKLNYNFKIKIDTLLFISCYRLQKGRFIIYEFYTFLKIISSDF